MSDRFGYDSDEGLIFDRTKPYTKGENSEGLYEEVTLPELIEHANSLGCKLGERAEVERKLLEQLAVADAYSTRLEKQVEEQGCRLHTVTQQAETGWQLANEMKADRDRAVSRLSSESNARLELTNKYHDLNEKYHQACRQLNSVTGNLEESICRLGNARALLDDCLSELPSADPRVAKVCTFLAETYCAPCEDRECAVHPSDPPNEERDEWGNLVVEKQEQK